MPLSFVVTVGRRHFDLFTWIPDRLDVAPSGLVGNSNALAEVFAPLAAAGLEVRRRMDFDIRGRSSVGLLFEHGVVASVVRGDDVVIVPWTSSRHRAEQTLARVSAFLGLLSPERPWELPG